MRHKLQVHLSHKIKETQNVSTSIPVKFLKKVDRKGLRTQKTVSVPFYAFSSKGQPKWRNLPFAVGGGEAGSRSGDYRCCYYSRFTVIIAVA